MRTLFGLLVVALLVGSAMPVQAQSAITLDFNGWGRSVDLVQDAGSVLEFSIADSKFSNGPAAAFVTLTCAPGSAAGKCPKQETLVVGLSSKGTGQAKEWTGSLSVDHKDLVRGNWTVVATGQSGSSTAVVPTTGSYHLDVTAPSVAKPRLRALNVDLDAGYVPVAKNQNVGVTLESNLIRNMQFQIDGGSLLSWGNGPYSLAASNFVPTGLHTLTVFAEDRIGQTTELSFFVYADTNDPNVAHDIPTRIFLGVPNKIGVNVTDDSNVTVSARLGEQVSMVTGTAGTREYAPLITPTELGSQLIEVRVEDVVGNVVRFVQAVDVVPLEVDVELVSVKQTDGGAIPTEDMMVTVEARQVDGIISVPVNVTFLGRDLGSFSVAPEGTTKHTLSFRMPSGLHKGNLTLELTPQVKEIDSADNSMMVTLEQFMARVIFRNDLYHIRASPSGLPDVAVDANGKTYPLTLKDRGLGTVYAFDVDGFELFWNPASVVTTVPEPPAVDEDGKGIPGLPLVALLGALASAGLLRRRA